MDLADLGTRGALLAHATDLVRTRGFCAFSYQDLADQVGIRKPSVHHHFPSKGDLGVAVVRGIEDEVMAALQAMEAAQPDVAARLRAWFGGVCGSTGAKGERICPMGALQAEWNALPEPMQEAMRRFSQTYLARLAGWLEAGRDAGRLAFPGSPRAMAQVLAACVQGALQRQRANPEEALDSTLDQALRLIGA